MVDVRTIRGQLTHATQSARYVVRCLHGGRDTQDSSQRATMLLVDIQDSLFRLKDQISWGEETWLVEPARLAALAELLDCFESTMRSIELFFQAGGVGVSYYRKNLLERTFAPRLEQYKVLLLLSMQPESSERSSLDRKIRFGLTAARDVESAPQPDVQFDELVLGTTNRITSEHFVTLTDLCNRRTPGTCQWIFDYKEYKRWQLGSFKTLYCVGPPGAGKTFLSATIIDSLQRTFTSQDVATIFIYCQDEKEKEQTTLELLQIILAQLVYRRRSCSHASSSLFQSEAQIKGKASPKAYQNAIRAEVDRFSKVFFVIDGLDMFSDKDRFLTRLQKLPEQVQLLVTLREVTQVGDASHITVHAPPDDLHLYAVSRIQQDSSLHALLTRSSSPRLYEEVIDTVVERSRGVFLMAKIHLDLLSRYQDKRILERALYHLPRTLPDAYGEAMKQVVSRNPTATRYVYWTLYALRPLSVSELRYATNTASNEHDFDAIDFEHTLQRDSGGILTVDGVTGKVCFIHRTAREYLSGAAARVFFPTAQNEIAEACLAAITADEVIDDCYYNGGNAPRSTENGFIEYAAMYWGHHSRDIPEEEKAIQVLIKTFLNKLLWRRPPLQVLTNEPRIPSELGLGKYPQDWTPLHVLAYFGIVVKSQRLLVQGAEIDANDNSYKITPLHCAASRGNEEMVEFLLDNGADGNAVARDGSTGLHLATQYNQRKVMKMLLARRLNSQIANKEGATSLQLAVTTEWDEATVPLLVKNKVDVNIRNIKTGDTALHLAIEWRRQRIILYLLDRGASIEMTNEDGLTPLQLAVKVDNCDAIALLLQRCAQVEARSLSGFTALQLAAQEKHWVAFDLLVIGGADINAWSKEGETLLHEQARKATSLSIALKLLEQGANIEAITAQQGYTPLHCAAAAGNKEMFMFLLERGAKISTLTARGESILHITPPINDDCLDILRTALDYDLDTNASTTEGWTPLHQAIYVGSSPEKSPEFIHLLLQHDADVTARIPTPSAETALHLAATAINPLPEIIPLLLSSGAEINALTADGKTALHLAAERGRESIFRLLYDAGADGSLDAPDSAKADDGHGGGIGNTAFEVALRNPLGRLWFDSEGKLRPPTTKLDLLKRESVGTVIDDGATESRFDDDDTTEDEEEEEDDETEESMSESECQSQSEIDLEESTRGRTRSRGDQKVNGAVAGVSISVVRYETPYVIV